MPCKQAVRQRERSQHGTVYKDAATSMPPPWAHHPVLTHQSGPLEEGDVVVDHRIRADRHAMRVRQVQAAEGYLVAPDLAQEVFEYLNGELLAGTASIAKTERCEAGIVADRQRLAVGHAEHRAERAVGHGGVAAVADLHRCEVERTPGKADLLALCLIHLCAGGRIAVA